MKLAAPIVTFLLPVLFTASCAEKTINHGTFAMSRLQYVTGQDGVSSIPFDENTTLWTFADTILKGPVNEKNPALVQVKNEHIMLSNSLAWTEKISSANMGNIKFNYLTESGRVTQFIKNSKSEDPAHHRLWALDGVRIGNRVWVYYAHVYVPDKAKYLQFTVKYIGLAVWDVTPGLKPGDAIVFRRAGRLFPEGYPFFGAAAMVKDGYVYVAGHSTKSESHPLSFARVKAAEIDSSASYEYLDQAGSWSKNFSRCGYFFGDVSGECSLSFNDSSNEYEIFYARMFTGEVVRAGFAEFRQIGGCAVSSVYHPPLPEKGKMWAYSAKEIFREGDTNYLIYIDPDFYQPILLEYKR